jgi:hypothetical protein
MLRMWAKMLPDSLKISIAASTIKDSAYCTFSVNTMDKTAVKMLLTFISSSHNKDEGGRRVLELNHANME